MRRRDFLTALIAPLIAPLITSAWRPEEWTHFIEYGQHITSYALPSPYLDLSVAANRRLFLDPDGVMPTKEHPMVSMWIWVSSPCHVVMMTMLEDT